MSNPSGGTRRTYKSGRRPTGVIVALALVVAAGVVAAVVLVTRSGPSPHPVTAPSSSTSTAPPSSTPTAPPSSTPTAPPTSGLKPQLTGTIDQNHLPTPAYRQVVHGFVAQVHWSEVQPTSGDSLVTTEIDQAVSTAAQYNMHLKLELLGGQFAPSWAMNLPVTSGTSGPFQICNTRGATPQCGQIGHFWESDYEAAYANLQRLLAAKYDNNPVIEQVDITGCMTIFEEPLLRQGNLPANVAAYSQAGYSESANQGCERAQIQAHSVWQHTQSSLAFNPYDQWTGSGFTPNESYTESLVDYCRQVLGGRCVIGNDSIGKQMSIFGCSAPPAGRAAAKSYSQLYTKEQCVGPPIYFRTASPLKLARAGVSLATTIQWASTVGAASVELPAGYDQPASNVYVSPSQLASVGSGLASNGRPPA